MPHASRQDYIEFSDYLEGERNAEYRSEYIDGQVYAMAEAGDGHVTITGNLSAMFKPHLRDSDCKFYSSDMKVRIGEDEAYYYPDVLVTCLPDDHQRNYFKHSPCLIIEVLSGALRLTIEAENLPYTDT
uniref:Putative restriction endonuclease domain-containing protein n=1 Tax=uncultured Thiotrichaceae bacterium TaxID=298394 RepID=A0A6S6SIR9_9GAMM|nr:MAG: Unknown protein [uncultured Thiotrichaceae bacterium]